MLPSHTVLVHPALADQHLVFEVEKGAKGSVVVGLSALEGLEEREIRRVVASHVGEYLLRYVGGQGWVRGEKKQRKADAVLVVGE